MGNEGERWYEENHALWEEMAALHPSSALYDVDAFVAGRDDLRPWEPEELGPVDGLDLLHLQCHIGTDTIGWARRGATVTGLDFSGTALAAAADLARRCGVDVDWVEADVYDARRALEGRRFDVVYTGIGALDWLPDITGWATTVRDLLRPGGRLYLMEIHPMWQALVGDGRTIGQDVIGAALTRWDDPDRRSYAVPDVPLRQTASQERAHSLGEIVTAVLDAGLTVQLLHEHAVTPAPSPWMELGPDRLYHFAPGMHRFPVCFSLLAAAPE